MTKQKSAAQGTSISTVLTIIFAVLKIAEVGQFKSWSWWLVTSPIWVPWLMILAGIVFVGLVAGIFKAFGN